MFSNKYFLEDVGDVIEGVLPVNKKCKSEITIRVDITISITCVNIKNIIRYLGTLSLINNISHT